MDENTMYVLTMFLFWGWIPILVTGKAISWTIDSIKNLKKEPYMTNITIKQVLETLEDKSMVIAMEEFAELQQAVSKGIRGKLNKDNLTEEMADAYIVLNWIKTYFDVSNEELEKWYTYKQNRIVDRLNRGELR